MTLGCGTNNSQVWITPATEDVFSELSWIKCTDFCLDVLYCRLSWMYGVGFCQRMYGLDFCHRNVQYKFLLRDLLYGLHGRKSAVLNRVEMSARLGYVWSGWLIESSCAECVYERYCGCFRVFVLLPEPIVACAHIERPSR